MDRIWNAVKMATGCGWANSKMNQHFNNATLRRIDDAVPPWLSP